MGAAKPRLRLSGAERSIAQIRSRPVRPSIRLNEPSSRAWAKWRGQRDLAALDKLGDMATLAPITDSIIQALAKLVDDSLEEKSREPTHSDLDFQFKRAGLAAGDPKSQGQTVGKAKRVRATLSWAYEHDVPKGRKLVPLLIHCIRGCGGFRTESPNYCGEQPILTMRDAFAAEAYELSLDGDLRPMLLDSLEGTAMSEALRLYVRRARRGALDAALVTGTGKDLLEATAAHVILEIRGTTSSTANFPSRLAQAYYALGLPTSHDKPEPHDSPQRALDRALFDAACAVNRLRNQQGTGHGRPWLPTVTDAEARTAVELMGIVADRLLAVLSDQRSGHGS